MADGTVPTIVRRRDALHVRAVRAESREVDFIASTETIDSYDEIVDQTTWDLARFEKNPVILYQHDRWSLPIGQATRCEVVKGQLECTIKFASAEANPEAEKIWLLVQEKVLRAVSVGFRPMDGKYEMRDGRDVYVLYNCELREISIVTVPANEDCLAMMKAASLSDLGVVTSAPGHEAEVVRGSRTPEMRERIRAALAQQNPAAKAATSPSTNDSPKKGDTEKTMTDAEKALQEQLDKSRLTLAEAQLAAKTAAEEKTKAETAATDAIAKVKTLETANATLTSEHAKACTDRDTNLARAVKAEGELIAVEVEALVGSKIAPTEKDDFIKLRTNDPDLFKSIVGKRADMKLSKTVIGKGAELGERALSSETAQTSAADPDASYFNSL